MTTDINRTSSVTPRDEASLPGGGGGSDGGPTGLKIRLVEVSLTVATNFWPLRAMVAISKGVDKAIPAGIVEGKGGWSLVRVMAG